VKVISIITVSILLFCAILYIAVFTINHHNKRWQNEREQIAIRDFSNNKGVYEEILHRWEKLYPAKCGGPAPMPGEVTFESLTIESNGLYSLGSNHSSFQNLTTDDLAKRIGNEPQDIRLLSELIRSVKSMEIMQSGSLVEIIFVANSSSGILHIDSSCPEASTYESWSRSSNDLVNYRKLRNLGNGWYYFFEAR